MEVLCVSVLWAYAVHTISTPVSTKHEQNQLLVDLSAEDNQRLLLHLEAVDLPLGMVVFESGSTLRHLYFPASGIVSLLYAMESGASTEIAVIGNEGVVGIALFMGGESTPSRAVVQSAGHGYRPNAAVLKTEFERGDRLPSKQINMTQELIANMLGVRREGVTEAAGKLQEAGLIRYHRGHITVLDRPRLEHRVCECYAVVKKEMDRLLPNTGSP